jgi:uncharacterized OB-fold protein
MSTERALEEGYFTVPGDGEGPPRLLGSYSPAAELHFFPRRRRCPVSQEPVVDVELSPQGVLYSWTYVVSPWMGKNRMGDLEGHGVGQVDLPEGVRVQTILRGDMGDWEIGMPMALELYPVLQDDDGTDLLTFRFAPVGSGGGA